jgi:CubicO group peptidase (beta-lactamase class C family)
MIIHGQVQPGFERVKDAFAQNFNDGDIGAAVHVEVAGEPVVDLWAGSKDKASQQAWEEDTLSVVYSASKGVVALAFLLLEDRGRLDMDLPVTHWWPAFGAHGKQAITVRTCLNHRAGLHALDMPLTLESSAEPETVDAAIEAQTPLWPPGTDQGYGATIWGVVMSAIFRRVAGVSLQQFIADEIAGPTGLELYLGLPDEHADRVATVYPAAVPFVFRQFGGDILRGKTTEGRVYRQVLFNRNSHPRRAFMNPDPGKERLGCMNLPAVRRLPLAWMSVFTTARDLSKLYGLLSRGGAPLVSTTAIDRLRSPQSWSYQDKVLCKPMGFSQGFQKEETHLFSPDGASFGHSGAGGGLGFADPNRQVGFGFAPNRLDPHIRSPRCISLCHALYRCLGVV